jgi:hypothetical protein
MKNALRPDHFSGIRKGLLDDEYFLKIANAFVDELAESARFEPADDSLVEAMRATYQAFNTENAAAVAQLAQSPIEKTFLNSLILLFIRSGCARPPPLSNLRRHAEGNS